MCYNLALTSGAIFAITCPRIYNPAAISRVPFCSIHPQNALLRLCASAHSCKNMISYSLLLQQSVQTSNALMEYWKHSTDFNKLAQYKGNMTVARDNEDGEKLQVGIDCVIDPNFVPDPYIEIDVLGKNPHQVADTRVDHNLRPAS
jgi:hypothetical protein